MDNNNQEELTGPQILVVDDLPETVVLLEHILRAAGYRSRVAYNGMAALQAVAEEKPDLILLDIMMPDIDGYEVCVRLREDPETRHIPVIILTAYGTEATAKVKGLRSGANDYLTKPVNHDELLARIETQLRLKELENQRVLAEKLGAVDQVVATLLHEINNPLTGVLGYVEILLEQIGRGEVSLLEIEEGLITIRDGGERIGDVMEKMRKITHPVVSEYATGTLMIDLERSH